MPKETPHRRAITRRGLVAGAAGAAAGTLAIATDPASAQRCPATPPARSKGPSVWLDLDQQDLDDAYDQSVYAFNAKTIDERRVYNNEIARSILGNPLREAYGPT